MTGTRRNTFVTLGTLVLAASLLGACSQNKKKNAGLGLEGGAGGPNAVGYGYGSDRIERGPVKPGTRRDFTVNIGDKVFFRTDSARLTPQAEQTLRQQARWLNQYPNHTITIEGHSDERGTRQYNLALAAKRAQAIRSFLVAQGVNPARMRTISYGKERPVALCNDISCWAKNRRGVTLLNNRRG